MRLYRNVAMPYREIPQSMENAMVRMIRMMKRFPRSLIFVGDHCEIPLGDDYDSWVMETTIKFRSLGMPRVYDTGQIFQAMLRDEVD